MLLVLAVVAAVASACGGEPEAENYGASRVLFIGNSLTADLPEMVAALARQSASIEIEYRTVVRPSASLEDLWNEGEARRALVSERWDVVVMQQGPAAHAWSRGHLQRWTKRWADAVRARGATPALLTVWPPAAQVNTFPDVVRNYATAAIAADAVLLPAGDAWLAAWRRDRTLALYSEDAFHPSELGTYLAALVAYGALAHVPAVGLPNVLEWEGNRLAVPAEVAVELQAAAAEVLGQ